MLEGRCHRHLLRTLLAKIPLFRIASSSGASTKTCDKKGGKSFFIPRPEKGSFFRLKHGI